jgi:hypothetical protein
MCSRTCQKGWGTVGEEGPLNRSSENLPLWFFTGGGGDVQGGPRPDVPPLPLKWTSARVCADPWSGPDVLGRMKLSSRIVCEDPWSGPDVFFIRGPDGKNIPPKTVRAAKLSDNNLSIQTPI